MVKSTYKKVTHEDKKKYMCFEFQANFCQNGECFFKYINNNKPLITLKPYNIYLPCVCESRVRCIIKQLILLSTLYIFLNSVSGHETKLWIIIHQSPADRILKICID